MAAVVVQKEEEKWDFPPLLPRYPTPLAFLEVKTKVGKCGERKWCECSGKRDRSGEGGGGSLGLRNIGKKGILIASFSNGWRRRFFFGRNFDVWPFPPQLCIKRKTFRNKMVPVFFCAKSSRDRRSKNVLAEAEANFCATDERGKKNFCSCSLTFACHRRDTSFLSFPRVNQLSTSRKKEQVLNKTV